MSVVKLTLEYDGTEFAGWAAQPGLRTVEGVLSAALDEVYSAWDGLAEVREYFEEFWDEALAAFKRVAEKGETHDSAGE